MGALDILQGPLLGVEAGAHGAPMISTSSFSHWRTMRARFDSE